MHGRHKLIIAESDRPHVVFMLAPQDSSSMGSPRLFLYRMVRAARLDGHIFTSLRDDGSATGQSLLVLALAGLSFGFGFAASVGGDLIGVLVGSVAGMAVGVLVGFVWLSLTYLVAPDSSRARRAIGAWPDLSSSQLPPPSSFYSRRFRRGLSLILRGHWEWDGRQFRACSPSRAPWVSILSVAS